MQKLIDSLLSSLSVDISLITSGRPPKKEHGDIMLNVFALAKSQGIPPNVCAENIAGLLSGHSLVASLSTIGGYVNIVLSTEGIRVLAEDSLHLVPQVMLANTHTIIDYIGVNV
jgi:arginyl-tRNA synthetase